MELSFMVIDDTELDHFIANKVISHADARFNVEYFFDANLALDHIIAHHSNTASRITLILLDIYMPLMNGFQFVEAFEKLDPAIQEKYYIVALSSSRGRTDVGRLSSYPAFKDMINKPFTAEALSVLINKMMREFGIQIT